MSWEKYGRKEAKILTKLITLVYNKTNIISFWEGNEYGSQRTKSGRGSKGSGGAD